MYSLTPRNGLPWNPGTVDLALELSVTVYFHYVTHRILPIRQYLHQFIYLYQGGTNTLHCVRLSVLGLPKSVCPKVPHTDTILTTFPVSNYFVQISENMHSFSVMNKTTLCLMSESRSSFPLRKKILWKRTVDVFFFNAASTFIKKFYKIYKRISERIIIIDYIGILNTVYIITLRI